MAARGLKIRFAVTLLLLIIVTTVIVALALTIFKPKDPVIRVYPFGLESFYNISESNVTTIGMLVTMENPNYGSFKYINSTSYVKFEDTVIAEIPMESEFVPARSTINVTTHADFMVKKLISNPNFFTEILSFGTLNMTSTTALPGKVTILKIIKLKATAYSSCDISFHLNPMHVDTKCISKIKL